MISETFKQAEAIVERLRKNGGLLAVFKTGGTIKATRVGSGLFELGMTKHPHKLVGVYSPEADPSWIEEDAAVTAG